MRRPLHERIADAVVWVFLLAVIAAPFLYAAQVLASHAGDPAPVAVVRYAPRSHGG